MERMVSLVVVGVDYRDPEGQAVVPRALSAAAGKDTMVCSSMNSFSRSSRSYIGCV